MKPTLFFTLLSASVLITCSPSLTKTYQAKEYGYIFEESTGQHEYILVDSKKVPIVFDSSSDKMAKQSLRALRASILYENSEGQHIFVSGEYKSQSHSFQLDHWFITLPFVKDSVEDENHVPHDIHKVNRPSLERSDFENKGGFDPTSPRFDPQLFEKPSSLSRPN